MWSVIQKLSVNQEKCANLYYVSRSLRQSTYHPHKNIAVIQPDLLITNRVSPVRHVQWDQMRRADHVDLYLASPPISILYVNRADPVDPVDLVHLADLVHHADLVHLVGLVDLVDLVHLVDHADRVYHQIVDLAV